MTSTLQEHLHKGEQKLLDPLLTLLIPSVSGVFLTIPAD